MSKKKDRNMKAHDTSSNRRHITDELSAQEVMEEGVRTVAHNNPSSKVCS